MGRGGQQKGGANLEKTILHLFKHYEEKGIFCEQNHPKTLTNGQIVQKHGFDFTVFHKNKMYAIDAKHCESDSFSLITNCKMHQVGAMKKIVNHGGVGFFAVYFSLSKNLYRLDVDRVLDLLESGVKSIKYDTKHKMKLDFLEIL